MWKNVATTHKNTVSSLLASNISATRYSICFTAVPMFVFFSGWSSVCQTILVVKPCYLDVPEHYPSWVPQTYDRQDHKGNRRPLTFALALMILILPFAYAVAPQPLFQPIPSPLVSGSLPPCSDQFRNILRIEIQHSFVSISVKVPQASRKASSRAA